MYKNKLFLFLLMKPIIITYTEYDPSKENPLTKLKPIKKKTKRRKK